MNGTVEINALAEGGFELTSELLVPAARTRVFDFFADALKLETITPPWLKFVVLTPPPIRMQQGAIIDYQLKLHGLPIRWTSEISSWDPPSMFVDRQLRGPYRVWRHRHDFEEVAGGAIIRDTVHYLPPLARLTHPLFVRRDLKRIFESRIEVLRRVCRSGEKGAETALGAEGAG